MLALRLMHLWVNCRQWNRRLRHLSLQIWNFLFKLFINTLAQGQRSRWQLRWNLGIDSLVNERHYLLDNHFHNVFDSERYFVVYQLIDVLKVILYRYLVSIFEHIINTLLQSLFVIISVLLLTLVVHIMRCLVFELWENHVNVCTPRSLEQWLLLHLK